MPSFVDDATASRPFFQDKQFIASMVDSFSVDNGDTRVAAVRYSGVQYFGVFLVFGFDVYTTAAAVKAAINGMPYGAGLTATGNGLQKAQEAFATARPDAKKIAILITDGMYVTLLRA
jgi:von Willebrand factor type A domain